MSSLPPDIIVVIEDHTIVIPVTVEAPPPTVSVTVSEVGLVGPGGPQGPQGLPGESADALLIEHINAATPHTAYDDGPSFALLYENAKV